jgi:hypothetical protein
MKRAFFIIMAGFLAAVNQSFAQDEILAEIRDIYPESIKSEAFRLDEDQQVRIDAVGAESTRREQMSATAWILEADTREVVWEMTEARTHRRERRLREFHDKVALPKGNYEVYYSFFPRYNYWHRDSRMSFGEVVQNIWDELFEKSDYARYRNERNKFEIVIRGKGRRLGKEGVDQFHSAYNENAIIAMAALWDDRYERKGFTLDRPMELQIYAIGEAGRDETYDYGWIMNITTREKVWKFDYRNSEPAGGAEKNRMNSTAIALPAGTYAACFVTDDSHSNRRWNAPPPYDPNFWGLTIRLKDAAMKRHVKTFDYEEVSDKNVIVQFTRLGDGEFRSQGFTLQRPMNLRVYAIGEGRDGKMFDYGWIIDAKTHQKIWTMEYRDTEHAGGGQKNRLIDKTLSLNKGSYIAYFVSDDSHSYLDWNTSAPFDREHWGLTITSADQNFTPTDVSAYEEKEDGSILAKLVRMRDHERRHEKLTLSKDTEVRIYALGEGSQGEMYDYGWIEAANTGKVVWEMTYRMTDHAGGARKNRVADATISLKAGEYVVYYKSDGSHSFNDWNDDPPHDPVNWGITVYAVRVE